MIVTTQTVSQGVFVLLAVSQEGLNLELIETFDCLAVNQRDAAEMMHQSDEAAPGR